MFYFILVIICLTSTKILKEYLIAASQLQMTNGRFIFVGFELDIKAAHNKQSLSFKWSIADYHEELGKWKLRF